MTRPHVQRGQAMTELIVAMAVILPLLFGIIYVAKYLDIKHQTIQASRFAAMQRAYDPNAQFSNKTVQDATVARFFRDGGKQVVKDGERATGATAGDSNPNWYTVTGDPMLKSYNDVSVSLQASNYKDPLMTGLNRATGFKDLKSEMGVGARVEVNVAKISHFDALAPLNVKIGSTTTVAGDPWIGGGTKDVADRFTPQNMPGRAVNILTKIPGVDTIFDWFAGTPAPQFGCIKPDITPTRVAPGAKYNPENDPHAEGVDKCL